MIISTVTELDHLLPPNVSSRTERLFALIEQTERSQLIPVLGDELYNQVEQAYQEIVSGHAVDADEHPIAGPEDLCPSIQPRQLTPMQQLIRLLQVPLVYLTLSNNAALLSVSLNDSGLNMVSAEGYDSVRKEDREAFSRDCYMNAHKGMEQVLLFLERDAQSSSPVFLKHWMHATGFFLHNGLLLRTASEFSRYVNINDSRETFIKLLPDIHNMQQNRLRPELGDLLMNAFVQFSAFGPQPRPSHQEEIPEQPSTFPTEELPSCVDESDDAFFDDLRPYLPYSRATASTPGEIFKLRVWIKALGMLRVALAYYVEYYSRHFSRSQDSLNDAMAALERFSDFVASNTASFQGVIEQSPYYSAPQLQEPEPQPESPRPDSVSACHSPYVHDPFETFYN